MKLPKYTFSDIPQEDVKKLLKKYDHPNISGTSDFIREYVSDILEINGALPFSSSDFQGMKEHLSTFDKVASIYKSIHKSASLKTIEFLSSLEYEDDNFGWQELIEIICYSDSDTLEYIVEICKSPKTFFALYSNDDIRKSLESAKKENLEELMKVCKTPEDFIFLCQEEDIRKMFWGFEEKLENLKIIIPFCSNTEDLKNILSHANLEDLIDHSGKGKLQYFIAAVSLESVEELISVLNQKTLCHIIKYEENSDLQYMLDLCGIQTVADLIPLSFKEGVIDKLIRSKKDSLDFVLSLLGKNSPGDIALLFNKDPKTIEALGKAKLEVLQYFIDIFSICDIDGLNALCETENLQAIVQYGNINNMRNIFNLYKIQSLDGFKKLSENIYFVIMLSEDTPEELLKKLVSFCETPEYFSLLCESESIIYVIENGIPESILGLVEKGDITKDDFFAFYRNFVSKSRDNARIILQNKIPYSKQFGEIFSYFFEKKKKSLILFIEKLSIAYEYELGIDISRFKTMQDFKNADSDGQEYNLDKLGEILRKMLEIISLPQKQEKTIIRKFGNAKNTKNIDVIQGILAEVSLQYFERMYHKKWNNKLKRELDISEDIPDEKLNNRDFIEAYKMSVSPEYNKEQIQKLLSDFLSGKFDDISKLGQFDSQKNKTWLQDNLTPEQQKVWLSKNVKEIDISGEGVIENGETDESVTKNRIDNHVSIAINKIKEINILGFSFQDNFSDSGELERVFNTEIKKCEIEIREKDTQNLYDDLKLQMSSIKELKQQKGKITKKSYYPKRAGST